MEIIKELTDYHLNPENEKIQSYFEKDNIWKILDIQRYEPSHSAFLAWFFKQDVSQYTPIKALLHLIIAKASAKTDKNILVNDWNKTPDMNFFSNSILTGSFSIKSVSVDKEFVINKVSKIRYCDKIDIFIRCSIVLYEKKGIEQEKNLEIIIENKVDSKEGESKNSIILTNPTPSEEEYKNLKQTKRYYFALSKENNNRKYNVDYQLFVYLTPFSKQSESNNFIVLSYQDLVDYILEQYLKRSDINQYARDLVESYLHNLGNPYNKNNKEILAMTTEERDLLVSFYERNENLFKCMIRAMSLINADDEEIAKEFKNIETSLKKAGVRRHYTINGKGYYTMRQVVEEFIKKRFKDLNNEQQDDEYTFKVIKDEIEITSGAGEKFVGTSEEDVKIGSKKAAPYKFTYNYNTFYVTKELGDKPGGKKFYEFRKYVNENYKDFQIEEI